MQEFFAAQEEKINKQRAEAGKMHKEAGEKYLAENAKKDGIVTLPSGLQYQVLKEGNGKKPSAKDSVKCHYEGFLIDGTVFDSSVQRGEPAVFGLQQVIAGWTEGLQLMQEGAKYRFFIPYRLAYGEGGAGASIPPYACNNDNLKNNEKVYCYCSCSSCCRHDVCIMRQWRSEG